MPCVVCVLCIVSGDAFIRPLRGGLTVLALVIGVATLTFAYGLHATLQTLSTDPALHGNDFVVGAYQVEVDPLDGLGDRAALHAIRVQPETRYVVSFADAFVPVSGLSDLVQAIFTRGDATRLGYHAISGRWIGGQYEAVAAESFLKEVHLRVGDRFTISYLGVGQRICVLASVHRVEHVGAQVQRVELDPTQARAHHRHLRRLAGPDRRGSTRLVISWSILASRISVARSAFFISASSRSTVAL